MGDCLVTGGAGFIGSHLVERLLAQGRQVRVLDDFSTGKRENLRDIEERIEVISGSITDPEVLRDACQGIQHVFHLAALPSVQRSVEDPLTTHEVCATGTLKLLMAAHRAGVKRVIYAASSSAYGDGEVTLRNEDDQPSPLSPYATAKLAGEHYCRAFTRVFGIPTVRLRFFNIFGPRQDVQSPYSGVIALFIGAMCSGRRPIIYGDGLQTRDFTYVANAVQALVKAAEAPAAVGNVYNIGNGKNTSIVELTKQLNLLLGTNIEPIHRQARAGDVRYSQADISRAQRDLGYEPDVSFREGLRLTLEFYKDLCRTMPGVLT